MAEKRSEVKVADEVWIAAALLQRENPSKSDFTPREIEARAAREGVAGHKRPGLYTHADQHCVANRPPRPNRYRMLFETARGRRRLFREGDRYDPHRSGGKTVPSPDEIPPQYLELLAWYQLWSRSAKADIGKNDPLLALYGSGRKLWADEHADEYVARLREGWE